MFSLGVYCLTTYLYPLKELSDTKDVLKLGLAKPSKFIGLGRMWI